MSTLLIVWDESQLWGLLAVYALRALGVPHTVCQAVNLPQVLAAKKSGMVFVPGGNARYKARRLGPAGREAVRSFVSGGGQYLGFCGGAGLALSWGKQGQEDVGLGLCPSGRGSYDDRMQHFMSGHLQVHTPAAPAALLPERTEHAPLLPVWWPGRFDPMEESGLTVLATYSDPAEDFWLADLPIATLPPGTFDVWRDMYGFAAVPDFLRGQPCMVQGTFGKGAYTLSYSHLETPASPFANAWFAHILREQGGVAAAVEQPAQGIAQWHPAAAPSLWEDATLQVVADAIEDVARVGLEHGLLFHRTPWLLGWRTGIPGASLNSLRLAIHSIRSLPPSPGAVALWQQQKEAIARAATLFHEGCVQYFLAERLAMTLAKSLPGTVPDAMLQQQRHGLFGPPMRPGGVYAELITALDALAFLQAEAAAFHG